MDNYLFIYLDIEHRTQYKEQLSVGHLVGMRFSGDREGYYTVSIYPLISLGKIERKYKRFDHFFPHIYYIILPK